MDKGSDDLTAVSTEAMALFDAGNYRKALPKFESALAMAEKAGDERAAVELYSWVITCHGRLDQVSVVECERIIEKLKFFVLSACGSAAFVRPGGAAGETSEWL